MKQEYADKLLKENLKGYNLIAEHFSATRHRIWPEIKSLFEKYIKPDDKVLDLGCGNGRFYEVIKSCTENYTGVDNCKNLIETVRGKYPHADFEVADAFSLPFSENCFDKIYSIAVLHHIPSKRLRLKFLKEVKRILKPKGLCVFTVWKVREKKVRLPLLKFTLLRLLFLSKLDFGDIFLPWKNSKKDVLFQRYYHFFFRKELVNLFKEAGFSVKKSGAISNERGNHCNIYIIAEKV